jgi:hypothetical protein
MLIRFSWLVLLSLCLSGFAGSPPADFPEFKVPGHEKEMASMRALYWLHYEPAQPLIPLWDEWMPMSTLWPGRGETALSNAMRERWAHAFERRKFNPDGYVYTEQHDGLAHSEGWPFPLWTQAGGMGWHFRGTGIGGYDAALVQPDGWTLANATNSGVTEKGWVVNLEAPNATAQTPAFSVSARVAPWLRLNWWTVGVSAGDCYIEWTTTEHPQFSAERRAYFSAPPQQDQESRTMIPMWEIPGWKGTITGLRICFANAGKGSVTVKSFHTACDTRHTINNSNFVRGTRDYFCWTQDLDFLRRQIGRMRNALRYMMSEFQTREKRCVYTTWPGHEGRTGVLVADGKKTIRHGEGIGGNYWDLLPFGGEDSLATIYYYDAVLDMAEIEEAIARNPQWTMPKGADVFNPADLRKHAAEVRDYGTKRFWNEKTGRFGTVDLDGVMHDYGFTFLNNEAIYYGFATSEQARKIRDWISGRRMVEGDTSSGSDIYHWRFGPRSTTKRNVDYYFWAWSSPESIPWGYQVQDGGAVLGFSYHDLMSRLKVEGPDATWERLRQILVWFDETQAAGGYREYYKDPSRGTMQGGNVPGGLGLDREFFESILVPQVMLYGFMGVQTKPEGIEVHPKLPTAWPALQITRVHVQDQLIDMHVHGTTIEIRNSLETRIVAERPLRVRIPAGWTVTNATPERLRVVRGGNL